ncbi:hypothetical protein AMIS_52760 [Actinoplanes missouriensis 431]|uniref:Integral membrane protein n=1 Tax=Actinoplanes missouriensis (strain ATCC 14538 / DSM 43046 / CBS 188.64 / JCM 3121 / NBRC 102363 / NCIMB 12654 / NRRL B-3342 / UNCC 431) TaxID=512565 RepID=I0HBV9_ACTM4|nr:hypothetical protein [Actinoplanes missouriensis]BAL90496.1 hypothetical protein AMIS_52760 [Actinoplanes missouriensis 431]
MTSPGRLAALIGAGGIAVHLALAGEHAGHAPAALAALAVLALICLPCGLRLWRRPSDRAAWVSLLALSGLMMLLHLGMRPQGAMLVTVLAVPAAQLLLGALVLIRLRPRSAVPDRSPV